MTLELSIAILSAVAAWIATAVALGSTRHPKPKVSCLITDAETPTYQNTGPCNALVLEKRITTSNSGKAGTALYIDLWTKSRMTIPPQVDTAFLFNMSRIQEADGYFGRYLNLSFPEIPPAGAVIIHIWCAAEDVRRNSGVFFEAISISTSQGKIKHEDKSSPLIFEKYPLVQNHSVSKSSGDA
jgi:hypothetical protein